MYCVLYDLGDIKKAFGIKSIESELIKAHSSWHAVLFYFNRFNIEIIKWQTTEKYEGWSIRTKFSVIQVIAGNQQNRVLP